MKRFTSFALVLLMSLQCFYKLGILTYFELNRDYIAEVLCVNKEKPITLCYGKCFLDKNLQLADESTDNGAMPAGIHHTDFPIFLISENKYLFAESIVFGQGNWQYFFSSSSKHSSAPFHPPAVSA